MNQLQRIIRKLSVVCVYVLQIFIQTVNCNYKENFVTECNFTTILEVASASRSTQSNTYTIFRFLFTFFSITTVSSKPQCPADSREVMPVLQPRTRVYRPLLPGVHLDSPARGFLGKVSYRAGVHGPGALGCPHGQHGSPGSPHTWA